MLTKYDPSIKCPYCGINNNYYKLNIASWQDHGFLWCEKIQDGCGKQFAYKVRITAEFKTAKLVFEE